uniref:Ycf1 protein n=1 Tax=Rubroshorea macrophylla TaxID=152423 RepID=UPI002036BCA8|nr:Ycf1 protein [Rubroshorea macrophylla]URH13690.1 Ycf1 protein [Rubroshorea macrophylla]
MPFIPGNLISKIINSVVVVGLYYGFLTTFSIGPAYIFLLRARVMKGEEGTKKKVSEITGFFAGQLIMFISIYYAPLHLALGRPHTILVLALWYVSFYAVWNNQEYFIDIGPTFRNEISNLNVQGLFLNNLIFQLFNHFLFPSAMVARLVNIYMFRCNNKMLFVTSSFVGWLIGHILFIKWVGLVLVWIQQKNAIRSIQSNKYLVLVMKRVELALVWIQQKNAIRSIQSNKYLVPKLKYAVSELKYYVSEFKYFVLELRDNIVSILLFTTAICYFSKIPLRYTYPTKLQVQKTEEKERKEIDRESQEIESEEIDREREEIDREREEKDREEIDREEINREEINREEINREREERAREIDREIEKLFEGEGAKQEQAVSTEEDEYLLWLENWFEKPIVTHIFNYNRRRRPFRYIKNQRFQNGIKNAMSQYFFYTCESDGKERIAFTYPPSLATFGEMIQKRISFFTTDNFAYDELENRWSSTNELKARNLSKEFRNRVETLEKKSFDLDILQKKTRLCKNETKEEYCPQKYDPFLYGSYRGRIQKLFSPKESYIKRYMNTPWINKIHAILISTDYHEFKQRIDILNRERLLTEEDRPFNNQEMTITADEQDSNPIDQIIRKYKTGINEISKKVPQDPYDKAGGPNFPTIYEIRSRTSKFLEIKPRKAYGVYREVNYKTRSQLPDYSRALIRGTLRALRRKMVTGESLQIRVHSPFFLDQVENIYNFFHNNFYYTISELFYRIDEIFRNWTGKNKWEKEEDEEEEMVLREGDPSRSEIIRDELEELEDREYFDELGYVREIRGVMLLIQSILRKYIILPSLIIAKNIARILLFQTPEWSEDFKDWKRERHIRCTYIGIPISENEFPPEWLKEGIQIKILYPFCLQPWQNAVKKKKKHDFCFLTPSGTPIDQLFVGIPREEPSFFKPIFKELKKRIKKLKIKCFRALTVLKEEKFFRKVSKETKKWIIKSILFLQGKKLKGNKKELFPSFGEIDEEIDGLGETKKDSPIGETKKDAIIINQMIHESSMRSRSIKEWTNFLLTEKKMKDLTERTNTIQNQLEKIIKIKDTENGFLNQEINISSTKKSYHDKILQASKRIWHIVKRRITRLIRKFDFFIQFWIERLYIDFFLRIINITRTNAQLVLESIKKKIIDKSIFNNERNQERNKKANKKGLHFISSIKKNSFLNIRIRNKKSKTFFDLSSFSQAYVFYKLSQTQGINLYKFKPILQYEGASIFLKNEIKNFFDFGEQGIFHYGLKHKNVFHSGMNEWKNWLKTHYQYDLSHIRWLKLVPEKWRNSVNQHRMAQNKDLKKESSYEKEKIIHYIKENDFDADSLMNKKYKKSNFQKPYRYNFFSYKSINKEDNEDKKDSYIYGSPLQVNNSEEIFYNSNTDKGKFFDMLGGIPIHNFLFPNYLGENDIIDRENFSIRKSRRYCDWFHIWLKNKDDIESWVSTKTKKNIMPEINNLNEVNNYQNYSKINRRRLFYFPIYQNKDPNKKMRKALLFDWMGMNEEILSRPIRNLGVWFFPKFGHPYDVYKQNPWIIPKKSLLSNVIENENVSRKKNNKKRNTSKPRKRVFFNKENLDSEREIRDFDRENEKGIFDPQKRDSQKQIYFKDFIKDRLLRYYFGWYDDFADEKVNTSIYENCFLLKVKSQDYQVPEAAILSILRGETCLDCLFRPNEAKFNASKLMKRGFFLLEPVRLSVNNDGHLILYQTISISLVHKNKQKINQIYHEEGSVTKNNFDELIARQKKMAENRDKNHYDLFVPETILSPKGRRELRILICFNSRGRNSMDRNPVFCNDVKNCGQVLNKSNRLASDKKKLKKLKFFLWPNYRLEDLACMNRYWFNTNNGSRFSMLRIHMYPRLKSR